MRRHQDSNNPNQDDPDSFKNVEEYQLLYNELRKLDRTIESKSILVEKLVRDKSRSLEWKSSVNKPCRYSVEFVLNDPATDTALVLTPTTRSFVVNKGTIFRPHSVDSALRCTYFTAADNLATSLANLTIPWGNGNLATRQSAFGCFLSIKDSGSNRAWQNAPIPDAFLNSGIIAPFYFDERSVLMENTEVFVTMDPFKINGDITQFIPTSKTMQYTFQVGFSGHEEFIG